MKIKTELKKQYDRQRYLLNRSMIIEKTTAYNQSHKQQRSLYLKNYHLTHYKKTGTPVGRPKGIPYTEDQKAARSLLCKRLVAEGRLKIPSCKGMKLNISPEGKLRQKLADKKSYWTPEVRARQSMLHKGKPKLSLRGANHYLWKGGITPVHQAIRNSIEYKLWREKVYARDNWTCVQCGARSTAGHAVLLQADHIKPFCKFPELRFDVSNGRTLCLPCHKMTDTFGIKASRFVVTA